MNKVKHDFQAHEFFIETPEGKVLLHYEREGNALNFNHTFVPSELRGQGIAEKVVSAGFEYVKQNNLKVIPSCSYVLRLVMKNPDWKKLTESS